MKIGDRVWVYMFMKRDCEYYTGFYEISNIFEENDKTKVDMHEIGEDYANRWVINIESLQIYNNSLIFSNLIDVSSWK